MRTAAWATLQPHNEAPRRPWPVERGTANYVNSNGNDYSSKMDCLQRQLAAPRIIATHWLRAEAVEVANG